MKKVIYYFGILFLLILPFKVDAASANINIVNNPKNVYVGAIITTNVTVSSSSNLGRIDYYLMTTDNLEIIKGDAHTVDYSVAGKKSVTYTYKFKAIKAGQAKVYIDNKTVLDANSENLSVTVSPSVTTVNEATEKTNLDSNVFLSKLEVKSFTLSPKFSKEEVNYEVIVPKKTKNVVVEATCEDKNATISGTGTKTLSDEENVLEIKCTNDDGNSKSYFINVLIEGKDLKSIKIKNKVYTLVQDKELLIEKAPEDYSLSKVKIDGEKYNCLKGDKSKLYLILLKDSKDNYYLYEYNKTKKEYTLYKVLNLKGIALFVKEYTSTPKNTSKTKIKVNGESFVAYNSNSKDDIYYLYGVDLDNGKTSWYKYNESKNEIEKIDKINEKNNLLIYSILGATLAILIVLLIVLIKKSKKRK